MPSKFMVFLGLSAGSTIGGFLPYLWGDTDMLSFSALFCSIIGGGIGLFVAIKLAQMFDS